MMRGFTVAALAATAFLAGCSRQPADPGAIGPDDQRQLNEAAAMLDANSIDPAAVTNDQADPR